VETMTGTLISGDYSLTGFENLVAIERKSLDDLIGCITGTDRERFKRELLRLRSYKCKAVIIESDLNTILVGGYHSRVNPESVLGSLTSWQTRYSIPFIFAGSATGAARYTLALFRTFINQINDVVKNLKLQEELRP
jgi:ERCC4-type nuclease